MGTTNPPKGHHGAHEFGYTRTPRCYGAALKHVPRLLDLDIRPLREADFDAVARLHAVCFPDKIETLLGARCITDTYHDRYIGPMADSFALVAVHRRDGRYVGFVYGTNPGATGTFAHAFISRAALKRHFLRRAIFLPRVWLFVFRRILRKLGGGAPNEGDRLELGAGSCVVKMVGVAPEFRFGNAAFDLMQAVEDEARRRRATRLVGLVERSNRSAERLYSFLGWVRTSPDRNDYAVFAMHKNLV